MTETLFFVSAGVALVVVLLVWVQRSAGPVMEPKAMSQVHEVLTAVQLELPSRSVGEKIFSAEDWEYVVKHSSREVQQRFLNERKAIAVCWLGQTRQGLDRLMRFHRKAIRGSANVAPAMEIRLALSYFSFVMAYDLLRGMIWLRGPFATASAVQFAFGMADQLSYLSGHVLVGMDPMRLSRVQSRWAADRSAA